MVTSLKRFPDSFIIVLDPDVDFYSLDIPVPAVATALKGFFSDLTEPLVPSHLSDQLIEAAGLSYTMSLFIILL